MNIFDIVEVSTLIKNSLRAGGEIKRAGILKTLKATIFPNTRPRLALYLNAIPPHPEKGDGSKEFKGWVDEEQIESRIIDLSTDKFLSPSDMEVLASVFAKIVNPYTRAYRVSIALRTPSALTYLIAQNVNREVQLLQYITSFAQKEYSVQQVSYQEFALPVLTKWERFGRAYAFVATIAFLLAIVGIVLL